MVSLKKLCGLEFSLPIWTSFVCSLRILLIALFLTSLAFGATNASGQSEDGNLDLSVLEDEVQNETREAPATAGTIEANKGSSSATSGVHFFELAKASGWIGVVLLALSIVAVTIIIRLCFTLRISNFIPNQLKQNISQSLIRGDMQSALDAAATFPSYAGRVLAVGLRESHRGWNAVEKAIEDSASSTSAKLYRATEPLSLIGNVAPMLGLLGTVMGMVSTFGKLAVADGSGRNLANGIYFALVTTVEGLLVAIPVLVSHSLINARLASLISEANDEIFRLLEPLRQSTSTIVPDASATREQVRSVHGLHEISRPSDEITPKRNDQLARPTGRLSLSLKNKRPDGE